MVRVKGPKGWSWKPETVKMMPSLNLSFVWVLSLSLLSTKHICPFSG
jgi:hypothetical protein